MLINIIGQSLQIHAIQQRRLSLTTACTGKALIATAATSFGIVSEGS